MAMQVEVIDESGEPVSAGEVGEVIMRGGGCCFGYFDDRDRTEDVFDVGGQWDGWFHSNDAGTIDEEGNLTIVGRLDDMIVRGGQNIYPAEIEDVLMEHDAIAEAAVIGMPDPELGERVAAYVVAESSSTVDKQTVVDWFDAKGLSKFKWPERLETVERLPKSPGGKIQKTDLRDDIEDKLRTEGKLS
jgi:acyl-coenzyme A synthetase/AMP-(fatty) acid ligase